MTPPVLLSDVLGTLSASSTTEWLVNWERETVGSKLLMNLLREASLGGQSWSVSLSLGTGKSPVLSSERFQPVP